MQPLSTADIWCLEMLLLSVKRKVSIITPPRPPSFLSNLSIQPHTRCRKAIFSVPPFITHQITLNRVPLFIISFLHPTRSFILCGLGHSDIPLIFMVILFCLLIPPHIAEDGQGTLQVQVCAQIFVYHVSLLHQKMLICYRSNMVQKSTDAHARARARSNVCTRGSSSNTILKYNFCLEKLKSVWKNAAPCWHKDT